MIISSLYSKCKSNPKRGRSQSSGDDVVWPSSIRASFYLFSPFSSVVYLCILFLLQVEVPPPMIGGTLKEEVAATPTAVFPSVGEEALSGGMTEEVRQLMQGVQPI